jgi:glycosyltransferase involved in cell wall biosynthesis
MDEEAAGPTQSVLRLCEALALSGQQVSIHTMAAGRQPIGIDLVLHHHWRVLGRFGFSLELVRSLHRATGEADILHNHSLWSFPNMAAGLATRPGRALLVTSPRGTLAQAARARSRFKKMLFSPLQRLAIARASCLHATSAMEYRDIRQLGLRQPVAVIPNGIDIPALDGPGDLRMPNQARRLLFLGRLHPIKGIEFLLNAWVSLQTKNPDWELVIAGKGESSYVQSLHNLASRLRLERVSFPGPVYGDAKRSLYRSSELFILPTETENFGMAIAEAQAHALPVITTHGAPWAGLVEKRSGWWVERTQKNIDETLCVAMQMAPTTLHEMGCRGREWMTADFDWNAVARQMASVYSWLLKGGKPPTCVFVD